MPDIDRPLRRTNPVNRTLSLVAFALVGTLSLTGCGSDPADPVADSTSDQSGTSPDQPSELDGTSMPPWPAPTDVAPRVASAGLNLGAMGTAEHYHPQLRIVVNGNDLPIPSNIGVDPATGAMSAVHTHEGDGTIHVEAHQVGEVFTLGQVFTQWGVKSTATQIGGVRAEPGKKVAVTSDGTSVAGDPTELRLKPEQKIVLRLG